MNNYSTCDFCNKEYHLKKEKEKHKFCSDSCRKKWHRRNKGQTLIPNFSEFKKTDTERPTEVGRKRKRRRPNKYTNLDYSQINLDGILSDIIPNQVQPTKKEPEPVPQISENENYLNQLYQYRQQLEYQSNLKPNIWNANLCGLGASGVAGLAIVEEKKIHWFQKILWVGGSYLGAKKVIDWTNKRDTQNTEQLKQQAIQELPNINQQIEQYEIIVMQEKIQREKVTTRRVIFEEEIKETEIIDRTISAIKVGDGYKMMTALDVINMESEKYELDGRWSDLFGYFPKNRFSAIIHGLPKNGKTHCCIQLAQYLQDKFLNVLYLSGEEGTEETFKAKLKRYDCRFKILFDIKGIQGIKNSIQDIQPTFVFVDSLTRLKLDVNDVIDLKDTYPRIAFFYILHSTKSGDYKGGSSIEHEVSSVVEVKDGIAYQVGRMIDGETSIDIFII